MSGNRHEPPQLPTLRQALSMRDVIFVLFRRRWIILAISMPIIIVGGISLFGQTGIYTAASRVVVELQKVELPQWNTTGRNVDYDRELSTLFNIAMSVPVAQKAAEALADSFDIIKALNPEFSGNETLSDLRDYLLHGLDVGPVGESTILEFRFAAARPRVALMASGAIRDAFIGYHNFGRRNPQAVAYYKDQIDAVRAQIDSLYEVRAEAQREGGYSSMADDLRHGSGQLADLQDALMKVRVDRRGLEREYSELLLFLDRDPREFPIGRDESAAESLVYLRNLVLKHEDELHSILSVHTEDSVPARRQQALLEQSLARLRIEQAAYIESVRLEKEDLAEREAILAEQIGTVRAHNSLAPEAYGKVSILDTEIESLRRLLQDFQSKWGEVRMNEMADDRVSSVAALTDPELISSLTGGKTIVYFAVLTGFALALGLVGGFVVESLDHRIYTPHDVEAKLRLPVLASIGEADNV